MREASTSRTATDTDSYAFFFKPINRQREDDRGTYCFMYISSKLKKGFSKRFLDFTSSFLTMLSVIIPLLLCGCGSDSSKEPILSVETNSSDVILSVIPESVTPISFTVETKNDLPIRIYVCADEKVIDNSIAQLEKTGQCDVHPLQETWVFHKSSSHTFRNLLPNTEYFIVGFISDWANNTLKISSKKSIKTGDVTPLVDLGGDIYWCGVNYIEGRNTFHVSQFLKGDLFYSYTLPDPKSEAIPGDWRYPTGKELLDLCSNCTVTFIDCYDQYVRLTSKSGNHLYVPFTYLFPLTSGRYASSHLMLFPCDKKTEGIYVDKDVRVYLNHTDIVYFGDDLKDCKIKIGPDLYKTDFYNWCYTDLDKNEHTGVSKRGCRFVCDKK